MTYPVLIAFLAILASLAAAVFFMLWGGRASDGENPAKTGRMAKALTVRVALSVALFVCILIGWKLGYIAPHGLAVPR